MKAAAQRPPMSAPGMPSTLPASYGAAPTSGMAPAMGVTPVMVGAQPPVPTQPSINTVPASDVNRGANPQPKWGDPRNNMGSAPADGQALSQLLRGGF